ncbi:MAG: hypothetical protein PHU23_17470 [Dehalococcoidales bacterium]|nr:hypothetical protein [Dehalococcoidales bacterium]
MISQSVQDKITDTLRNLSADIIWIEKFEDADFEKSKVAGLEALPARMVKDGGAIITLGNIYLQKNDSVNVAASIWVGDLAAGGITYIVDKRDGIWKITGTTGVRWIS